MEFVLTERSSLYWLGRMEGNPEHSGAWFFHDDYGPCIWIGEYIIRCLIYLGLTCSQSSCTYSRPPGSCSLCVMSHPLFHLYSADYLLDPLVSWWWIFFRIVAIVNILRSRREPEMALQFLTLTVGLAIESVLLTWFFSIPFLPYLFKWARWDRGLWYGHLPPLLAMLAAWVLVVVIGLCEDLPNILFPCSGSTSLICRVLTKYAY